MKDLVIVGSGGFAKEVLWLANEYNKYHKLWNILGFISNTDDMFVDEYPIIGDDKWLININRPIDVLFGIGSVGLKHELYLEYAKNRNIDFPTIVSDNAIISDRIVFGKGCLVCAGNIMTVDIKVGNFVTINLDCTIGHDVTIEDYVQINPGANISGNVHVGSECEIGTGSAIIQGVNIGDKTIIGAGSVVIRNVDSECTVVGNPARVIKSKD